MQRLLFLLLVSWCLTFVVRGQDTSRVYFDFGKSKVKDSYKQMLLSFHDLYDLSSVDSVRFIGYADSVGKIKNNMNLAKRRAENVWEISRRVLPDFIPYSIVSYGEDHHNTDSLNRRVEIIFYYPKNLDVEDELTQDSINPRCYLLATDVLAHCNVRVITKRKKEYVQLITSSDTSFSKRNLYYGKRLSNGGIEYKELRWKLKKIGDEDWRKNRLVTEIPRSDYSKYGIFELQPPPCSGCRETILTSDTLIVWKEKYYPNVFLSELMDISLGWFGKTRIRVPSEFVDMSEPYFVSTSAVDGVNFKVEWFSKKSKRKKKYLYAKLDFPPKTDFYLKQKYMTSECRNKYLESDDSTRFRIMCGGVRQLNPWTAIGGYWTLESGIHLQNTRPTGYLGMGYIYILRHWDFGAIAALEHRIGFLGQVHANYNIKAYLHTDRSYTHCILGNQLIVTHKYWLAFYAGSNLQVNYAPYGISFLQSNVYLGGFYARNSDYRRISRIYLQSGIGYDYLQNINPSPFFYAQLGVRFRITSLLR